MTNPTPATDAPTRPKHGPKWRSLVRTAIRRLGGTAKLADLYAALVDHPKTQANRHYRAKIRQTVQLDPEVERIEPGVWRLKSFL